LKKRAVFLDRDGTINEEVGHLGKIEKMIIYPDSSAAIRMLNEAGFKVVLITNQAGVARGYFDEDTVKKVNEHLMTELALDGAKIDAAYFCPHHPEFGNDDYRKNCDCRKPEPGMLIRAANDLNIDLSASFMVGDTAKDIVAGKKAGCRTVLVLTGHGEQESKKIPDDYAPALIANNLQSAVQWILIQ
jgi:D-glycero-D-manno-heptose 1,7-bisphosphate phosphatase